MKFRLYDAGLVRRLRKAVKEHARRSGIKGLQKRWWSGPRLSNANSYWKVWFLFIAVRAIATRSQDPKGTVMILGCVSLAFAGIALQRAKNLRNALTRSFERAHSHFYPVSEAEFVERTLLQAAVNSWWLLPLAVALFVFAQPGDSPLAWLTATLAALAELFLILGLAYALEPHLEIIPFWLPWGFFGMAVVWFYTPRQYALAQQVWVNVLPTGWVNLALSAPLSIEVKVAALAAATVIFVIVTWFFARSRRSQLLARFEQSLYVERQMALTEEELPDERPSPAWPVLNPPEAESEVEEAEEAVQNLPIQATWQKQRISAIGSEWGEAIRRGEWLQRWDWSQMTWMERAVGWWLSPEEKDTLWFLLGAKVPSWSNAWKNSVIALAVGVLLVVSLPMEWKQLGVIAFLVSMGFGLPFFGGAWAATNPGWISGKVAPIHSVYPLRYRLASRVIAKVNLVRTLAWLPFVAVLAILEAKLANKTIPETLWFAARAVLIWLSWMPITIAGKFSKGSNDTTMNQWRQVVLIPLLVLFISGVAILWGTILIFDNSEVLLVALASIAGSVGTWAAYGWWYNRKVDLLRDRQ
ncbi:MAG TPA: hypothetical protein VKB48_18190 [Candidatus Acidoferrum sp.]|nr:hypothetical protein [Candidatus Acidoferrum sp.]